MTQSTPADRILHGSGASGGVALGPAFVVEEQPLPRGARVAAGAEADEIERFGAAARMAADELEAVAARVASDGHPDEAGIFTAQAAMALDSTLAGAVAERINTLGEDAVAAAVAAAGELADGLRALDDETLAARAADLEDVSHRIARILAESPRHDTGTIPYRPSIVVAAELAPSVAASIPRDRLLGIALEGSSVTAHAAILARAYGIPAVVGAGPIRAVMNVAGIHGTREAHLADDVEIAIDGGNGEIVVRPGPSERGRILAQVAADVQRAERDRSEAALPAVTLDGIEIELLANIGTPAEAHRAIELGAHGVGLFRTEFLFLERRAAPTEDEQVAAYRSVADAFAPWPVTIRLLDAGGDKAIPYFGLPHEANPFLGVRGIRLADVEPNIFVSQLRAAMRAAATDGETHEATAGDHERGPSASPPVPAIKLMAPMVADESDVATLHQLVTRAAESLAAEGIAYGPISVGAMVEVPSAVVLADRLFPALDFVSLGTNDLLQYVLAADRGHAALSHYHDPFHPALLRLVRSGVTEARRVGIELSVCGEMAADPLAALALVGLGVRTLSMAAGSLATVRRHIRARTLFELTTAVVAACDAATGAEARAYLNELVAGRRLLSDDRPEEAHHDEEAREQGDQPEPAIG